MLLALSILCIRLFDALNCRMEILRTDGIIRIFLISYVRRLIYWVVYGILSCIDGGSEWIFLRIFLSSVFESFLVYWIPFYYPLKLLFLLWVMLPQYQVSIFFVDFHHSARVQNISTLISFSLSIRLTRTLLIQCWMLLRRILEILRKQ